MSTKVNGVRVARGVSRRYLLEPVALILASTAVIGGCGSGSLSADSTCEQYMKADAAERHEVAVQLSTQYDGVSSPGNPMWGLSADGACESNPALTLGEYFDPAQ